MTTNDQLPDPQSLGYEEACNLAPTFSRSARRSSTSS